MTPLLRSRHAVLHDRETGETYQPLRHIDPAQAPVFVHNSSLSEYAVLGYELGFSLVPPPSPGQMRRAVFAWSFGHHFGRWWWLTHAA